MAADDNITVALERLVGVFEKRPATAMDTTKSRAVMTGGFRVDVTEGDNTAVMDMGDVMGGWQRGSISWFLWQSWPD